MCVTTNNAELFSNAFPIEKSYYFSSGLAAVRGMSKLSSLNKCLSCFAFSVHITKLHSTSFYYISAPSTT